MNREQVYAVVVTLVVVYAIGVWHFATHERARYLARRAKARAEAEQKKRAADEKWKAAFGDLPSFNPLFLYETLSFDSPAYAMAFLWPVSYPVRAAYRAVAARSDARSRALSEQYLRALYANEVTNATTAPTTGLHDGD